MNTKIYALHGFLGLPWDWDVIEQALGCPLKAIDLQSISQPKNGLEQWGQAFNKYVAKEPEQERILLGYSLGGRLALHALIDRPELWTCAIIVSANTGLQSNEEKKRRLQTDMEWSQRFLKDVWEELIEDWNSQNTFQGQRSCFERKEKDFVRGLLADVLVGWSLAKQNNLQESLSKLALPILWVAGEKDTKYIEIAKRISASHPQSSFWIAKDAGHRVPWESTELFVKQIKSWLFTTFPNFF